MFRTTQSKTIFVSCGAILFALSTIILLSKTYKYFDGMLLASFKDTLPLLTVLCFLLSSLALLGYALLPRRYQLRSKRITTLILLLLCSLNSLECILNVPMGVEEALRKLFLLAALPEKMGLVTAHD